MLCLLSAVFTVASSLVNLYVSPAILAAVERHVPVTELLLTIAGFVLGTMLIAAAAAYVDSNVIYGKLSVRMEIINLLNRKAATTSYPNVEDETFSKLLMKASDCISNHSSATEAVWTTLTGLTANLLGFVLYAGLLGTLQPVLILVILLTASVSYFMGKQLNEYGYRHREEEAEHERHMDYVPECAKDLAAAKDIRIFGLRPWLDELHRKAEEAYTAFHRKAEGVYLWAKIADLVLTFLRNGVAYAYLINLVLRQGLGVAEFLLYFNAAGGFSEWVVGILKELNMLHKQSLDISTLRECLSFEEPFLFEGGEPVQAEAGKSYEIRLENVSFRYPGAKEDTLRKINLTLRPGEKLAVVGLNGAGKTTLVKLLCGFLDPTEGRVLLDGKDIRSLNRTDYYRMFSAVFQTFSLIAGSIAVNVAQREEQIDMDRVRECVKKAGLGQKIQSLPKSYETRLNRQVYEDAVMLSGGETQRLMLARVLYKDGVFMILDEPTAALDPIAEADIYQRYNELTRGKTCVYISHRLASTRFCDRIILIENGKISEEGTHEELLQQGGSYAGLYEVQSKYYREGADGDEKK